MLRSLGIDPLELLDTRSRCDLRQPAGEQVVARVPAGDVNHVPAQPDLLDVLEEDDLHRRYWET